LWRGLPASGVVCPPFLLRAVLGKNIQSKLVKKAKKVLNLGGGVAR